MKAFVINRNSWHYKLNRNFMNQYSWYESGMEYQWEPRHNDFCSYWRATVFRMIGLALIIALSAILIGMLGLATYMHPLETLTIAGYIVGVFVAFVCFLFLFAAASVSKEKLDKSLFAQKYKAHKSKFCPMVGYEK
jgi:cytosine/uracil/thiamine/allantoin permease